MVPPLSVTVADVIAASILGLLLLWPDANPTVAMTALVTTPARISQVRR